MLHCLSWCTLCVQSIKTVILMAILRVESKMHGWVQLVWVHPAPDLEGHGTQHGRLASKCVRSGLQLWQIKSTRCAILVWKCKSASDCGKTRCQGIPCTRLCSRLNANPISTFLCTIGPYYLPRYSIRFGAAEKMFTKPPLCVVQPWNSKQYMRYSACMLQIKIHDV